MRAEPPTSEPLPEGVRHRLAALLAHPVVQRIREACGATPTHLVGGVVRDALLGRSSHDFDIVTADDGEAIARRLAEALPARLVHLGGKSFPAYRLVGSDFEVDLWDRERSSFEADLARRDLTINALAVDVADGSLVDRFGGLADLTAHRLRATTEKIFAEDPLRVLRVARFAVELPGFAPEEETVRLARRSAPELSLVASERVREELDRLLKGDATGVGFVLLARLGIYPALWGADTDEARAANPESLGREVGLLVRLSEEVTAGKITAQGTAAEETAAEEIDLPAARLALSAGALAPADRAQALLAAMRDRGLLFRKRADRAIALLRAGLELPDDERSQRHYLHRCGRLWTTALAAAGARAEARGTEACRDWRLRAKRMRDLIAREAETILDPPRLLSGEELSEALGLVPGPEIGRLLRRLEEAQVEGRVRNREEAWKLLRALT